MKIAIIAFLVSTIATAQSPTVSPRDTGLLVTACGELKRGYERIGGGRYGLRFDVPSKGVKLIRGSMDVDYVVHVVKAPHSDDHVEFWFGIYAIDPKPDSKLVTQSRTTSTREILRAAGLVSGMGAGAIGSDTEGSMPSGNGGVMPHLAWRALCIAM